MRPFLEEIRHGTPAYAFQIYHMDLPEKASAVNYHWKSSVLRKVLLR